IDLRACTAFSSRDRRRRAERTAGSTARADVAQGRRAGLPRGSRLFGVLPDRDRLPDHQVAILAVDLRRLDRTGRPGLADVPRTATLQRAAPLSRGAWRPRRVSAPVVAAGDGGQLAALDGEGCRRLTMKAAVSYRPAPSPRARRREASFHSVRATRSGVGS